MNVCKKRLPGLSPIESSPQTFKILYSMLKLLKSKEKNRSKKLFNFPISTVAKYKQGENNSLKGFHNLLV